MPFQSRAGRRPRALCDPRLTRQGNANWLTVGAVVSCLLSVCMSCCGAFGRFATGRSAGEKVSYIAVEDGKS
jgi:hypothetical protein